MPVHRAACFKTLCQLCGEHYLELDDPLDRDSYDALMWFVFLLPVILLVLVSAGALEDGLHQYNFAELFSCCQFVQTSNKKKINFRKSGGKSKWTKSKSNEEDQKQHVSHLNLLNISTIVSIQSSFLRSGFNLNGLLVVFDPLHLISPWFAWISHRISWNGLFFSNTLPYFRKRPRRSFRLNPGIYIRRPKQGTSRFSSRSQNHEQDQVFINIVHFLSVRDYCAKRLQYWDQQYYCNHAQHIFFPAFFLTQH